MTRTVSISIVTIAFAAALSVSPARADDRDEARRLFQEALVALETGQAADGRELLRRSLELYPTLSTRVNLGIALRRTGETPQAIATFEALLDGRHGALSPSEREAVREQLELARRELATLRITVRGPPTAALELDGEPAGEATSSRATTLEVGPGRHVVVARAEGYAESRSRVRGESGTVVPVLLQLEPLSTPGTTDDEVVQDDSGGSAWIWILVAAVAVAAAVSAVVLLTNTGGTDGDEPALGTYETLRF